MTMHPLRVTWRGATGVIHLDDLDISNSVHAVGINLRGGDVPEVVFDLLPGAFDLDADVADVEVDARTRAVLVALGWTPPTEEPLATRQTPIMSPPAVREAADQYLPRSTP